MKTGTTSIFTYQSIVYSSILSNNTIIISNQISFYRGIGITFRKEIRFRIIYNFQRCTMQIYNFGQFRTKRNQSLLILFSDTQNKEFSFKIYVSNIDVYILANTNATRCPFFEYINDFCKLPLRVCPAFGNFYFIQPAISCLGMFASFLKNSFDRRFSGTAFTYFSLNTNAASPGVKMLWVSRRQGAWVLKIPSSSWFPIQIFI